MTRPVGWFEKHSSGAGCATVSRMASKLNEEKISIKLPQSATVVKLARCSDDFYRRAMRFAEPIDLHRGSWICTTLRTEKMRLPEFYAALTSLTGPSGEFFDSYKGAFAFPFKMTVRRGEDRFKYLLMLMNFRSMIEPNLYRLDKNLAPAATRSYHAPYDNEISLEEVAYVLSFIAGYLSGFLTTMPKWTTPFVFEVQSNGILFGYDPRSGTFFEEEYRTEKAYDAALAQWREIMPDARGSCDVKWEDVEADW